MNILLTGGAGYIGSETARTLASIGHNVAVLDNLTQGHREAIPDIPLFVNDVLDQDSVLQAIKAIECDAVMHFAALTNIEESVRDPARYYRNNVLGTLTLLGAMREAGVNKFVFSSSAAVYGRDEKSHIDETAILSPVSPYGHTKVAIESALADYANSYGLAFCSFRYFNAAGATPDGRFGEDHEPETHLIPRILNVALGKSDHIDIYGSDYQTFDGTCIRDYLHVSDIADAHVAALSAFSPGEGTSYNLGSGHGTSVNQVINVCRQVTGHEIPTAIHPRRPGDLPRYLADTARARTLLNWCPRKSGIENIIQTAWYWHSQHAYGYADRSRLRE